MECRWLLLEYFCFTFQESYADFYYSKECILFSFTIAIFLYWRLRTVTSRPSLALLPMHDPVDSSGFILHLEHSDDIVLLIFVTTEVGGSRFWLSVSGSSVHRGRLSPAEQSSDASKVRFLSTQWLLFKSPSPRRSTSRLTTLFYVQ